MSRFTISPPTELLRCPRADGERAGAAAQTPPPCHVQDIHVSDVWFSYTFKMKATDRSGACRVLGSISRTVWVGIVESELSPGVKHWRCGT